MADALLAGVSGMKVHQTMIDVAGNNLANVNTTSFKASRVRFSDLLSETLKDASQPSGGIGGTNPQQVGSGVKLASVDRDMAQGSLLTTGQALDMAIEGGGYFVLNDGQTDVYTRVGAMAVDSDYYLVDPATGYRMQRIGSEGVSEGFQSASSSSIRVPYDQALPARATEVITYNGNLSADGVTTADYTTTNLRAGVVFTTGASGASASRDTLFTDISEGGSTLVGDEGIVIAGTRRDGSAVNTTFNLTGGETIEDFLDAVNAAYADPADPTDLWSLADIRNGELRMTDADSGYSLTDIELSMAAGSTGSIDLPNYFQFAEVGGEGSRNTTVEIFNSQGVVHALSATFVKTSTLNKWDLVLTSLTGDVDVTKRRVAGINFLTTGAYGGLDDPTTGYFTAKFAHDPDSSVNLAVDMGTTSELDGLQQVGGASTAVPSNQDGYAAGWLSNVSVSQEGVLVGLFSNGARRDLAALKLATFQNPSALVALGRNYFAASSNSGDAVQVKALTGGAGAVHGGSLEKSNVDVANEFVNLIQAQNGFQANARTIRVSNEMLRELTNLIR